MGHASARAPTPFWLIVENVPEKMLVMEATRPRCEAGMRRVIYGWLPSVPNICTQQVKTAMERKYSGTTPWIERVHQEEPAAIRSCPHARRPVSCRRREKPPYRPVISGVPTMTTTAFTLVSMPNHTAPFAPYSCSIFSGRRKLNWLYTRLHTA